MSLRWKLFRFLHLDTPLSSADGRGISDAFNDTALFPALAPAQDAELNSRHRVLRRFSTAAERALARDSGDGFYAFALARGVAQLFNLGLVDPSLALGRKGRGVAGGTPLQYSFSAHEGGVIALAVVCMAGAGLPQLVTLGLDDETHTVKVWSFKNQKARVPSASSSTLMMQLPPSIGDVPPSGDGPAQQALVRDENRLVCSAVYRLQGDSRPTIVTVKDAKAGVRQIEQVAVGFEDGSVTILSGEIANERAVRVRVAPAPGEMIEAKPIAFASYCGDILYCVSEMSVVVILPVPHMNAESEKKGPMFRREILDNLGATNTDLCCTIERTAELVVAREEALYFFNREGRGPCLAFPTKGDRAMIFSAGNYLIHATGPGSITAYDVANKLIAYRGKGTVFCTFQGWTTEARTILLCIADGSILRLSEIPLEGRVNMLLKRGLYVPAVRLARAERKLETDESRTMLTRALRQYAEYLMSKDRYDEAAEQLVETIGDNVEPSWVITRLVEQSGLRSGLRLYLEALHSAGKAAFVHTKVLITCYRHDRARGTILGSKAIEKTTDEYVINVFSDVDWTEEQVDAAIKLCRDAGLFKVAERVSRRRGRYVQLARTLVEDLDESGKALELLASLKDAEALRVIQACGRELLEKDAASFVQYLSDAMSRSFAMMPVGQAAPVLQLDAFLSLFIDMPRWRAVLLEKILGTPGGISTGEIPRAWVLLFESLVCVDVADRVRNDKLQVDIKNHEEDARSELDGLTITGKSEDRRSSSVSEVSVNIRERRAVGRRALKILQSRRSVIDLRAALEVAEQYGHYPCLEYLYEHLRLYRELGMCLRLSGNGTSLLRACRRHGDREPRLWMECIRLFAPLASKEEYEADSTGSNHRTVMESPQSPSNQTLVPFGLDTHGDDRIAGGGFSSVGEAESERISAQDVVDEAMIALDRSGMLSPMEIIDVVTNACPEAAWGVVREYFERCTTGLRRDAATSEHSGLVLDEELDELRKEARRLGEEAEIIKSHKCASCEDNITVPAIHFFCRHSYHTSCLAPGAVSSPGGPRLDVTTGPMSGNAESAAYLVVGPGGPAGLGVNDSKTAMWGEECPRCAPELDALVSMRQALQDKNQKHDEFFGKLKHSRDGFATIIEFLERSPFL